MKSFLLLLAAATAVSADTHTFYTLNLQSPNGVNITTFGGTLTVPEYPPGYPSSGETYYIWPGLQGSEVSGVFQQVMSPENSGGTWSIDSGYYSSSDGQPFQSGYSGLNPGDQVYYHNFDNGNGQWTTEFALNGGPVTVTDDWPNFQGLSFNLADWAIELYNAPWNFGEFKFTDVFLTWESTDTSACCNSCVVMYNGNFTYTVEGASASVSNGVTNCYFSQISLNSPNS